MEERELEDLVALVPPLLQALEVLGFVARHFHPPDFETVMTSVGRPEIELARERPRLDGWPEEMAQVKAALAEACDEALAAFAVLREATEVRAAFRAFAHLPRAMRALYPLAGDIPPVNRFFLPPGMRDDGALLEKLAQAEATGLTSLLQSDADPAARGSFCAYVPEYYSPDRPWPLVVALHGGSGNGGAFLWSWLREARAMGAILIAPTAVGATWALSGPDDDSPNLERIAAMARGHWNIDPARMLLTGMSDGGTFTYVSGLESGSPFTHLAPVSAAFHPMLAQFADQERAKGLPVRIIHGSLDWMFPVATAAAAARALKGAGADVSFWEIEDLSHTYPREAGIDLLAWMNS